MTTSLVRSRTILIRKLLVTQGRSPGLVPFLAPAPTASTSRPPLLMKIPARSRLRNHLRSRDGLLKEGVEQNKAEVLVLIPTPWQGTCQGTVRGGKRGRRKTEESGVNAEGMEGTSAVQFMLHNTHYITQPTDSNGRQKHLR